VLVVVAVVVVVVVVVVVGDVVLGIKSNAWWNNTGGFGSASSVTIRNCQVVLFH